MLGQVEPEEAIRPTRVEGLEILPADARLADAALMLVDAMGREHRFRRAPRSPRRPIQEAVVVDCPPALSLVTVNVLAGVGELIIPVRHAHGVYAACPASAELAIVDWRTSGSISATHSPEGIAGLLLTRTHNNRATRDIADQLRAAYGELDLHRALRSRTASGSRNRTPAT